MSARLLESLVTTEPLADVFSDRSLLAALLRFEAALARVESEAGVIPAPAAAAITRAVDAATLDAAAIAREARASATIAIPFVDALRSHVARIDREAATFVHWGATSQDLMDTALVLCIARAAEILEADHKRLRDALRHLSERHARTIMLGRTLLQAAPPTTFGLKTAGWYAAVSRAGHKLFAAFAGTRILQLGGASGTLAALGPHGPRIAADLARALGLEDPGAPWHTQRDRLATLVVAAGVYCGTLGKIARDISLLMQPEVHEATEPGGKSSAMPHKRNPAACAITLAAVNRVPGLVASYLAGMTQEHERGLGGWQAEGATVATVVQATGAALCSIADAVGGLSVDADRMAANLSATSGMIFAERAMMLLAPALGREAALRIVEDAVNGAREGQRTFAQALSSHAEAVRAIPRGDLAAMESPEAYLGAAEEFRRRLLADAEH